MPPPPPAKETLLGLINEFSKVAGYKMNMQKSAAFLYTNSGLSEKEIKQSHTQSVRKKNLHNENYKVLMKETEDKQMKDTLCLSIRGINS